MTHGLEVASRRGPAPHPRRWMQRASGFLVAVTLAACSGLPERTVPPEVLAELPATFDVGDGSPGELQPAWWRAFGDAALDAFVEAGVERNTDVLVAAERLREARAILRAANADRLPDVGIFVDATRERTVLVPGQPSTIIDTRSAGATVAFEADLWGRLAATSEAARRRLLAERHALDAVRLSVAAELTRGYLQVQSLGASRAILLESVALLADQVRLNERRRAQGEVSELDLQRFRAELEDARAQLADVLEREAGAQRALLLLAGQLPSAARVAALAVAPGPAAPDVLPAMPLGLPSDLLQRRPDLRAAEAQLAAAGADVVAARRAWLPRVQISGSAGDLATRFGDLFDGGAGLWSAGAALTQAVFDGGRRRAATEAAESRRERAALEYRRTVRRAFADVLDASTARDSAAEIHRARSAQASALSEALRLAERRFAAGYSDYLEVLDARRSLLAARLAVSEARRRAGAAYVDLALALGGGWGA